MINRFLCVMFMTLLLPHITYASPILVVDDDFSTAPLNNFVDIYIDQAKTVTSQTILTPELQRKFAPLKPTTLAYNDNKSTLWLRLRLTNHSRQTHFVLQFSNVSTEQYVIYKLHNNSLDFIASGNRKDFFTEREITTPSLFNSLSLDKGSSQTLYIKLENYSGNKLHILLHDSNDLYGTVAFKNQLAGIVMGILFTGFLFNLVFSIYRKKKLYFIHALYILTLITLIVNQWGYGYFFIEHEQVNRFAFILALCGGMIISLEMALSITCIDRRWGNPSYRYYRLCQCMGGILLAYILIDNNNNANYYVYILAALSSSVTIVISLNEFIRRQNKLALYLSAGRLINIFAVLLITLNARLNINDYFSSGLIIAYLVISEAALINCLLLAQSFILFKNKIRSDIDMLALINQKKQHNILITDINQQISRPLNEMMAIASLLKDQSSSARESHSINNLIGKGRQLLNTLDEVVDESRINHGEIFFNDELFELNQLIEQCCEGYRHITEQKNIDLVANTQPAFALRCQGDRYRIRQILLVLIHNAIQNTDHGEVVVSCKTTFSSDDIANIYITVKDSGRGLSYQQLRHIFEPQTLVDENHTFNYGSSLPTIHRLITLMGGELTVQSQIGSGCIFYLNLQLPAKEHLQKTFDEPKLLAGVSALLIENSDVHPHILGNLLTDWGIHCEYAYNASEALAKIRNKANIEEPYQLLLIDYDLGSLNGLQLAERIRNDIELSELNHIAYLFCSPSQSALANRYRAVNIDRLLDKSFDSHQLKLLLCEDLEQQNTVRTLNQQPLIKAMSEDKNTITHQIKPHSQDIKVLIIEDNKASATALTAMLLKLKLPSQTAVDTIQIIDLMVENTIEMILMTCKSAILDCVMTTTLIRQFEQEHQRTPIPIIGLTAHLTLDEEQQSLKAGMNAHLAKPVDIHALQLTIKAWQQPQVDQLSRSLEKSISIKPHQ